LRLPEMVEIDTIPMTQTADHLGYVGRYRGVYVNRLIRHIQKKGVVAVCQVDQDPG
jgi:hypothetical protein